MTGREEKSRQLLIDYKMAFESEGGKRVREDLESKSGFNRSVIPRDNVGRIDPLEVMRNEGQRSVIIHILTKLNKDPNKERQKGAINE